MKIFDNNQRKDFFVKKWVQFKFTLIFIITIIICNTAYGIYVFDKVKKYLNYELYRSHTNLKSTWDIIYPVVYDTSIISFIILILAFIALIYFITRRYSKSFNALSDDLSLLNTGDLVNDFNSLNNRDIDNISKDYMEAKNFLKVNIATAKENVSKLDSIVEKLNSSVSNRDKKGVTASIEEMEYYYNKLQNSINKFNA